MRDATGNKGRARKEMPKGMQLQAGTTLKAVFAGAFMKKLANMDVLKRISWILCFLTVKHCCLVAK